MSNLKFERLNKDEMRVVLAKKLYNQSKKIFEMNIWTEVLVETKVGDEVVEIPHTVKLKADESFEIEEGDVIPSGSITFDAYAMEGITYYKINKLIGKIRKGKKNVPGV